MATGKLFPYAQSKLTLTSTTTYSYRTGNVNILDILNTIPALSNAGFYIYNATNVSISVTPVLNVFKTQVLPDVALTATTVDAGTSAFISIPSEYFIANYFSANIKASATPKGYVQGFAIINYLYTTK